MDPLIQIAFTIVVVAIIGAMKFYERKYGSNPEAWDMNKFVMLVVVAIVVMAIEYQFGNAITFPAEDIIMAGLGVFGAAYALITGGKLANTTIVPKVLGAPIGASGWSPGYTVTPAFSKGVSAFTQHFHINAGAPAADHPGIVEVEIDWMDATPKQLLKVVDGFAEVDHTFSYEQGDSKYTGHSFYPEFVFIMNNGERFAFNVDGKGVEVEVQSG